MFLIIDSSLDSIFNFNKAYSYIITTYNFKDAYFIFQKQRIFVAQLGSSFFNNRENWIGIQQRYVIFKFVYHTNSYDYLFYNSISSYYNDRDIVFLPFNWYTSRLVYWDSSALIRGPNGYYPIFSVDSIVLGYVNERSSKAFSGGSACVFADSDGKLITPKVNSDGKELVLNNASVIFPIVTAAFDATFTDENGGTIDLLYGYNTSFNFYVSNNFVIKNKNNNLIEIGASIRRNPEIDYKIDRRNISSTNLDFIQAVQPAIVGVTILAIPINLDPTPSIIIPDNNEFRTSPSYQRLNDYEGIEFNTFDFENNSYVESSFNVNDGRQAIIKSISSESYFHTSSLTLYDNKLYYLNQGKNTVFSVQKEDNSIPVNGNLFKFFRYDDNNIISISFRQGYIDNNGSLVSSNLYINSEVEYSTITTIAIFDRNLLNDYYGSFSYYDASNNLIYSDEYSSLPELKFFTNTIRVILTIKKINLSNINVDFFNDGQNKVIVSLCKIDLTNQNVLVYRCCLSSQVYSLNDNNIIFLNTELPESLFKVYLLMGIDNNIIVSQEIKMLDTEVTLVGNKYAFLVLSIDSTSQSIEEIIADIDSYGKIINLIDINNKEGKMITLLNFPSTNDVRGVVDESLVTYSIEESGAFKNKQTFVVSTYPKNSNILTIKDKDLLDEQYNSLLINAKSSLYPYKLIIENDEITNGIRMFKEAFKMFNYKSAENVISFSVILYPKWTNDLDDGYYYSNYFSYFNISLLPCLDYISFNSLNTVKNSFSVIYSDLGKQTYNKYHPFCIQSESTKVIFHRSYEKKNKFRIWSDSPLEEIIMSFSSYASFNIFY